MPKRIKTLIAICMVFHMLFIVGIINFLQIPEIIRCEILTAKYGHEFENSEVYKNCSWMCDVQKVKVLDFKYNEAYVYYICGGTTEEGYPWFRGIVAEFTRTSGKDWENRYDVVKWTKGTGNNEGVVMPYWWHWFIYG